MSDMLDGGTVPSVGSCPWSNFAPGDVRRASRRPGAVVEGLDLQNSELCYCSVDKHGNFEACGCCDRMARTCRCSRGRYESRMLGDPAFLGEYQPI